MSLATRTDLRATRVGIDPVTHADVFPALVSEDRWNGWACPTFDRATAERVIAMVTRDGDDYHRFLWTTDRDGKVCLLQGQSDGSDDWWWEFAGDDATGYGIGAYSWTWQECDDLPTHPDDIDRTLAEQAVQSAEFASRWNTALNAAYAEGATAAEAYGSASRVTGR